MRVIDEKKKNFEIIVFDLDNLQQIWKGSEKSIWNLNETIGDRRRVGFTISLDGEKLVEQSVDKDILMKFMELSLEEKLHVLARMYAFSEDMYMAMFKMRSEDFIPYKSIEEVVRDGIEAGAYEPEWYVAYLDWDEIIKDHKAYGYVETPFGVIYE